MSARRGVTSISAEARELATIAHVDPETAERFLQEGEHDVPPGPLRDAVVEAFLRLRDAPIQVRIRQVGDGPFGIVVTVADEHFPFIIPRLVEQFGALA